MASFTRRIPRAINWPGMAVILGVLVVWQLAISLKVINYPALPGPLDIVTGLGYISSNGMWPALGHTVKCALEAWLIASVIGMVVGLLLGLNATVASWASATVDVFRAMPVVAFIPIAILLWGNGSEAEVILGAYAALWPMLINTSGGVRGISPRLYDVARSLQLSRQETITKIIIPSTGVAILVGARLALTGALVVCVVAEMLGLQSGVGYSLMLEQSGDEPARMWAYVILVGILGILANLGLAGAVRLALPGMAAYSERSLA